MERHIKMIERFDFLQKLLVGEVKSLMNLFFSVFIKHLERNKLGLKVVLNTPLNNFKIPHFLFK